MAWSGTFNKLQMAEGDFGIGVPFTIHDVTIGENDSLKFTFKETVNGETILITTATFPRTPFPCRLPRKKPHCFLPATMFLPWIGIKAVTSCVI